MRLFLLIIFIFSLSTLKGNDTIIITKNFSKLNLGKTLHIYQDNGKNLDYYDAYQYYKNNKFTRNNTDIPFYSYNENVYWLGFTLFNETNNPIQLLVELDYPLLYKVDFYSKNPDNSLNILRSGDGINFKERNIDDINNLFKITLPSKQFYTCFFRIESDGDITIAPVIVYNNMNYIIKTRSERFYYGLYYGILLIIIILNLYIFKNTQDKGTLFYVLYVLFFGCLILVLDGYAFKYFWPNFPWLANRAVQIFTLTSMIFFLLFNKYTLNTKIFQRKINTIINYLIFIELLTLILSFFNNPFYKFTLIFINILSAISLIIVFISSVKSLKNDIAISKYIIISTFFMSIGVITLILRNFGVSGFFELRDGIKYGSAIEILIIAYGISIRFKALIEKSREVALINLDKLYKLQNNMTVELEKKVYKRTQELELQKNNLEIANANILNHSQRIEKQKEEILEKNIQLERLNRNYERQKDKLEIKQLLLKEALEKLELRKQLLEHNNKLITDNISYAKRIQRAIFPKHETVKRLLPESFILLQPKDLLSGDFYWVDQYPSTLHSDFIDISKPEYIIVAAIDCTGHGVPGALMSMISYNLLSHTINEVGLLSPAEILSSLNRGILDNLNYEKDSSFVKDGMDLSLILIKPSTNKLYFAGAKNPIYIVNNDEIKIYKGDKYSIGDANYNYLFTEHEIGLVKGDTIYMFSDGYADQFIENGLQKFGTQRLKKLLLDIYKLNIDEQKKILLEELNKWKGNSEQIDDILFIGYKY